MGIHIKCNNKNYTCGYQHWNTFKSNISIATIHYINSIKLTKHHAVDLKIVKQYFANNQIIHADNKAITIFLNTYSNHIQLMNHLKLYGIYLLVANSDCSEIIYTADKCIIIEESINLITPHLKKDINEITTIFDHSVHTGFQVVIH